MATSIDEHAATEMTRRRYNRAARLYDFEQAAGERFMFGRLRRRLWEKAPASGRILEIGVGTGVNMPYYPLGARVTAIDLSERMIAKAHRRAERRHIDVDLALMDAQHLDFPAATFDSVIATCVFCSVPDPVAGLREAWRVLKPGGTLLLLEHVRSGNPVIGKIMDLMNPVVVRMAGANINRRTLDNVRSAGVDHVAASSHMLGIVRLIEARKTPTEG